MNGSLQIKPMRIVISFSCRRNRIYPGRGEDAGMRELAPSAHPFQGVAITQSICASLKCFSRTHYSQIPSGASRQRLRSYNFDRINDVFVVKNTLTSYNLL